MLTENGRRVVFWMAVIVVALVLLMALLTNRQAGLKLNVPNSTDSPFTIPPRHVPTIPGGPTVTTI